MRKPRRTAWALTKVILTVAIGAGTVPLLLSIAKGKRPVHYPGAQLPGRFDAREHGSINYLIYLPEEYGQAKKKWPLLLFLHGSEQRGADLDRLKQTGIPLVIERGIQIPFVVVSPQCPRERSWEPVQLLVLLDDIQKRFAIDKDRVYVTGYELGGRGTWDVALADPYRFAAKGRRNNCESLRWGEPPDASRHGPNLHVPTPKANAQETLNSTASASRR